MNMILNFKIRHGIYTLTKYFNLKQNNINFKIINNYNLQMSRSILLLFVFIYLGINYQFLRTNTYVPIFII